MNFRHYYVLMWYLLGESMVVSTLSLSFSGFCTHTSKHLPHSPPPHHSAVTPLCISTPPSLPCQPCLSPALLGELPGSEVSMLLYCFPTFLSGSLSDLSSTRRHPGESRVSSSGKWCRSFLTAGEKVCSPLRITALTRRGSSCYCMERFSLASFGLSSEASGAKSGLIGQIKPWAGQGPLSSEPHGSVLEELPWAFISGSHCGGCWDEFLGSPFRNRRLIFWLLTRH